MSTCHDSDFSKFQHISTGAWWWKDKPTRETRSLLSLPISWWHVGCTPQREAWPSLWYSKEQNGLHCELECSWSCRGSRIVASGASSSWLHCCHAMTWIYIQGHSRWSTMVIHQYIINHHQPSSTLFCGHHYSRLLTTRLLTMIHHQPLFATTNRC